MLHFLCISDQDEVHERDRFSDFLLIALRDLLTVNRRLKLILMSAALDINLFIDYFGKCPVVHGRSLALACMRTVSWILSYMYLLTNNNNEVQKSMGKKKENW